MKKKKISVEFKKKKNKNDVGRRSDWMMTNEFLQLVKKERERMAMTEVEFGLISSKFNKGDILSINEIVDMIIYGMVLWGSGYRTRVMLALEKDVKAQVEKELIRIVNEVENLQKIENLDLFESYKKGWL